MEQFILNESLIKRFENYLIEEERSALTIDKYLRDLQAFYIFVVSRELDKQIVLDYKKQLIERYKPASVNSMLAALNSFFTFCGWTQLRVKPLKIQRSMFAEREKELTQAEYKRLLNAAKLRKNERLYLLMQTICATGIRVSELQYITVDAVMLGRVEVSSKGKRRTVFLNIKLRRLLASYIKLRSITTGSVFISRNGNPLNRHRIWADMKTLCDDANVESSKVFPHNLRHLFARTFYSIEKDLGRLADILGHSNVNTTRIYTMEYGREHERILNRMSLVYQ